MSYFAFSGGLDLVSSTLEVEQGRALLLQNYGLDTAGNPKSVKGYERYDGQLRPSLQSYHIQRFTAGSVAVSADDVVTGATSSASGIALVDAVVETGSWGGGDAAGYLVLWVTTGAYQDLEDLEVSASKVAEADGVPLLAAAATDADNDAWVQLAIEKARAQIAKVPGSGRAAPFHFGGIGYAIRDNAGATAAVLHKATGAGWVAMTLGETIDFTAGTLEFAEAETLTGGTSAATAQIDRVIVQSGDWSTNDAAGYIVISVVSGTFQAETGTSASGSATLSGASTPITIPIGGEYEFLRENFYGHEDLERIYGVSGVTNGFEFDGTVYTPIRTGMVVDKPIMLSSHKQHLFFIFPGGSLQHSSTGVPLVWSPITGAAELTTGKEITGAASVSGVLAIMCSDEMHVLYGNDVTDWDMKIFSPDVGCERWSLQGVGQHLMLDQHGIRTLSAAQEFGDFATGTITEDVQPLIGTMKGSVASSCVVREANQYRLFLNDGSGLCLTFRKGSLAGVSTLSFPHVMRRCFSDRDASDREWILAGSDDGYVFNLEQGASFDGADIETYYKAHYWHFGSPRVIKGFRRTTLEINAPPGLDLWFEADFDHGSAEQAPPIPINATPAGGGGSWNIDNWNEFNWSSQGTADPTFDTPARASNMSIYLYSKSKTAAPHTLYGAVVDNFKTRRRKR